MRLNGYITRFFLIMGLRNMAKLVLSEVRRRMNSNEIHYGFYFDLNQEIQVNQSSFSSNIRPICPEDLPRFFYSSTKNLSIDEVKKRLERLLFLKNSISTCYVLLNSDQFPCALCWLIMPKENDDLKSYFGDGLPLLKPNEVLLEFVFVHPDHRGKKLMEIITKKLFVRAKLNRASRAIAFVSARNTTSLAATLLIGWQPFLIKHVTWKFFKRQITFEHLKSGHFEKEI